MLKYAKSVHFLFNLHQIQDLPQNPGSQDSNVLWSLEFLTIYIDKVAFQKWCKSLRKLILTPFIKQLELAIYICQCVNVS